MPTASPIASAAGTTDAPGCDCDALCESSVSSECASTPLTSAASTAPVTVLEATTVATGRPASARASVSAARPGGSSAPEIIAATVSSTWWTVCSTIASGSARSLAAAM